MTFPAGDYTPYGYISNHSQFARSWNEVYGGTLRTDLDYPGFGWVYPTERRPTAGVSVGVGLMTGSDLYLSRGDFSKGDLSSPYHSANIFAYAYRGGEVRVESRYFQASDNVVVGHIRFLGEPVKGTRAIVMLRGFVKGEESIVSAKLGDQGLIVRWQRTDEARRAEQALPPTRRTYGRPFVGVKDESHTLGIDAPGFRPQGVYAARTWDELRQILSNAVQSKPDPAAYAQSTFDSQSGDDREASCTAEGDVIAAVVLEMTEQPSNGRPDIILGLRRHPSFTAGGAFVTHPWEIDVSPVYPMPLDAWEEVYQGKLAEDTHFWQGAPRLEGDWPKHWKNGFVYDLETTRICTFPAKGVFRDVWPSWMASYPRVVLAEGSMDMSRLAYADPDTAKRAILSMFRDTSLDNAPCIYAEGQPNMVAADGSVCGTSPAWCLPFYNIYLVYLRTLDTEWIAELYPYLVRFTEWWLTYRSDEKGYINYKCTWEAGEDCSTRLDPEGTGSADISGVVRPVETQATMAHCCYVMAAFARALGRDDDADRWNKRYEDFVRRTREMFDPEAGRFRDVDLRTGTFLDDRGPSDYWGSNPKRHSVLSLTSLLLGVAAPKQVEAMRKEIPHYANPPWSYWPSWTYVTEEAAVAAGLYAFAGENAARIVDRVYVDSDRREFGPYPRGFPGVAREYWPPLDEFKGSDAYAWGAHTATLIVRQIVGFRESENTDRWEFRLAPALAAPVKEPGKRYGVTNLHYRGRRLNVWVSPKTDDTLAVTLELEAPAGLHVANAKGESIYTGEDATVHTFTLPDSAAYTVWSERA